VGFADMSRVRIVAVSVVSCILSVCVLGCGNKFFDPTQVGRFRPVPAVNVILDSLGVAEETPAAWEIGEEPKPVDLIVFDTDYVFGPGDGIGVSIYELFREGMMFASQYVITETGKLSIPEVGVIEAVGLTEAQMEEEIKEILSPHILKDPVVHVTLLGSQSRVYSILGSAVPRPGRYGIPRHDYRLADALATAGGISQFNISYIYVSRPITGEESLAEPSVGEPSESGVTELEDVERALQPADEMLEIIAPMAKGRRAADGDLVMASAELATDRELAEAALPEELWPLGGQYEPTISLEEVLGSHAEPLAAEMGGGEPGAGQEGGPRVEWVFRDGKWVPVRVGGAQEPRPGVEPGKVSEPLEPKIPADYEWQTVGTGGAQRRVIRIPADRLLSGDPHYNIVIRPRDAIHVPFDIIGEFCIMGNVNRQGFIPITGRPMTLKMAIAAAGGMGPLAWPKRCEVVRRIGKKREEIVMVDLDKIARGEQPDFFIKPNDLINVGTHPTARWRAVLRNAFRATYGFGFIYDRNFADRDYGTSRPFGSAYGHFEDLF